MATRATGKVMRFGVAQDFVNIRLDIDPSLRPLDNWFKLPTNTPNYNALFSFVVAAAANRWPLTIRTEKEIVATEPAIVRFMVVGWEGGGDDD